VAGFIVCCWRHEDASVTKAELEACAARLAPDNIWPQSPRVVLRPRLAVCATNPVPVALLTESGVCVGRLLDGAARWDTCLGPTPDGSYAIARFDEQRVELLTDAVASRTIWYVKTERLFLASTSQRALAMLLRGFRPDPAAATWLLTSGNLGPEAGWDLRVARVPANARLLLDRARWRVHIEATEIGFEESGASSKAQVEHLFDVITDVCRRMDLDDRTFVLPLSGGLDSRSILLGMRAAGIRPRCLTWGPSAAADDPKSDAGVAARLARALDLEHRFYPVEPARPFADVLRRFVELGEGQVEDLLGYVDGMQLFATLFDSGVQSLVRGDEPSFGEYHVYRSEHQARIRENGLLVSDYPQTHPLRRLDVDGQVWPHRLRRRTDEGLEPYSARLYEQHYVTAALAPLNHIKCAYMEVANPLLSRRVIAAAHGLSTSLRTGRRSLKEIASLYGPAVPFSVRHSSPVPCGLLALEPLVAELRHTLASETAATLFPEETLRTLRAALVPSGPRLKTSLKGRTKEVVPKHVIEHLHPVPEVELSPRRLAFRACLSIRAHELFREDAGFLPARSLPYCRQDHTSPDPIEPSAVR